MIYIYIYNTQPKRTHFDILYGVYVRSDGRDARGLRESRINIYDRKSAEPRPVCSRHFFAREAFPDSGVAISPQHSKLQKLLNLATIHQARWLAGLTEKSRSDGTNRTFRVIFPDRNCSTTCILRRSPQSNRDDDSSRR